MGRPVPCTSPRIPVFRSVFKRIQSTEAIPFLWWLWIKMIHGEAKEICQSDERDYVGLSSDSEVVFVRKEKFYHVRQTRLRQRVFLREKDHGG